MTLTDRASENMSHTRTLRDNDTFGEVGRSRREHDHSVALGIQCLQSATRFDLLHRLRRWFWVEGLQSGASLARKVVYTVPAVDLPNAFTSKRLCVRSQNFRNCCIGKDQQGLGQAQTVDLGVDVADISVDAKVLTV